MMKFTQQNWLLSGPPHPSKAKYANRKIFHSKTRSVTRLGTHNQNAIQNVYVVVQIETQPANYSTFNVW